MGLIIILINQFSLKFNYYFIQRGKKMIFYTSLWTKSVSTTNDSKQLDRLVPAGKRLDFYGCKLLGTVKESVSCAEDLDHFIFQTTERC